MSETSPLTIPCVGDGDDVLLTDLIDDDELIDQHSLGTLLDSMSDSGCWGMHLSGDECTPGFQVGQGHFKNKFCAHCRQHGFSIAATRVCTVTPALRERFKNTNGRSVWTAGSRVVNQTAKCTGPSAIIFKDEVPAELTSEATACPSEWVRTHVATGEECIQFVVSKGTLVPEPPRVGAVAHAPPRAVEPARAQRPPPDRLELLHALSGLEQLVSLRLSCDEPGAGVPDEPPLSEAEVRSLEGLRRSLDDASALLRRHAGSSVRGQKRACEEEDLVSFPPSPPGSRPGTAHGAPLDMITHRVAVGESVASIALKHGMRRDGWVHIALRLIRFTPSGSRHLAACELAAPC